MASLVTCQVCKKEHSDDVKRCPHCGAKYSKPFTKRPFAKLMAGAFGLIVFSCVSALNGTKDVAAPTPKPPVVIPGTPLPATPELKAKFATERTDLMARLNGSLKTKDRYSIIFVASDFEKVADADFLALLEKVRVDEAKTTAVLQKKFDADEKKAARKKGVTVGMTREKVKASSWGNPSSVNTTTSAFGDREQWVYGTRSYLYFENGVLTTIQN